MEDYTKRPLSAIPARHDDRDFRPSMFVGVTNGNWEDIMIDCIPDIYDQGQRNMCVGFAGAGNRESQQWKETGIHKRMSPGYIYGNREPGTDYCGEGMDVRQAVARMCKEGTCLWEDFPILGDYPTCHTALKLGENRLRPLAAINKAMSYVRGYTEDDVYTMLKNGMGPVMITVAIYDNFYRTPMDGVVPDRLSTDQFRGHHEMLLVGRKKMDRRRWVINNSWGKQWGDQGRCYMPVDSVDIVEYWGITDYDPKRERNIIMDCSPTIIPPGRVVIPLRFVAEALGGSAEWDASTKTATIKVPALSRESTIELGVGNNTLKVYY